MRKAILSTSLAAAFLAAGCATEPPSPNPRKEALVRGAEILAQNTPIDLLGVLYAEGDDNPFVAGLSGVGPMPSLTGGTGGPSLSGGTGGPSLSGGTGDPSITGGTGGPWISGGSVVLAQVLCDFFGNLCVFFDRCLIDETEFGTECAVFASSECPVAVQQILATVPLPPIPPSVLNFIDCVGRALATAVCTEAGIESSVASCPIPAGVDFEGSDTMMQ